MGQLRPFPGAAAAALSVIIAVFVGVLGTAVVFGPPARDLALLGAVLALTCVASSAAVLVATRIAAGLPLRWQVTLFATIGLAGVVLNISAASAMMFLSPHDFQLLLILMAVALIAGIGPAQLMARAVSSRIERLEFATERVAAGELDARVVASGRDEIARLSQQFNSMAGALERSHKERDDLERARRDLFAAISHDLRTPLASMRVMVEAIADGVVADAETKDRYIHSISGEIKRLSKLIDDLFELTKIDSGELRLRVENLRIEDVVAETLESFGPKVELSGIRIGHELSPSTPAVSADPERLSRVICNLLENAIRHTPSDGSIVLRTELDGTSVRLSVSDSGEGVAPEDVPFLFDRFYRGDRARARDGAGSGLGLAIARGIIEAHGGRIWIDSPPGCGTTVTFALPGIR